MNLKMKVGVGVAACLLAALSIWYFSGVSDTLKYYEVVRRIPVCNSIHCQAMKKGQLKPGVVFRIVDKGKRSYLIELKNSKNQYYLKKADYRKSLRPFIAAETVEASQSDGSTNSNWWIYLLLLALAPGLNFAAIVDFYRGVYRMLKQNLSGAGNSFDEDGEPEHQSTDPEHKEEVGAYVESGGPSKISAFFQRVSDSCLGFIESLKARFSKDSNKSDQDEEFYGAEQSSPLEATNVASVTRTEVMTTNEVRSEPQNSKPTTAQNTKQAPPPPPANETQSGELEKTDVIVMSGQTEEPLVSDVADDEEIENVKILAQTVLQHQQPSQQAVLGENTDNESTAIIEFPDFQEFTNSGVEALDDLDNTAKVAIS